MESQSFISLMKRAIGDRTLRKFAEDSGINAGHLSRIVRGQIPSPGTLKRIAESAYNSISYEDLLDAAGFLDQETEGKFKNMIPIYGTVAAGLPILAHEDILGHVQMTYGLRGRPEDYFALRVKGDSMQSENIPDGSIVIVSKQPVVNNGDIAVIMIDGQATVKKFFNRGDYIMLVPASPNPVHQPQVYGRDHEVKIMGKVVKAIIDI